MPSAAVKTMSTSITIGQNNKTSEGGEVKAQSQILSIADPLEPFRQTVTLVEHKIRNMEKRKGKLDSYKQEQEQGKELNADQLAAIAKYGEVVQNLDFARDLVKQFTQIQAETGRLMKKQSKKEQVEKAAAELERAKDTIRLSNCIQQLAIPRVREDFAIGKNGAILVGAEELKALDELSVISGLKFKHETSNEDLERAAEHLLNLLEGKPKPVCASSGTTYKDLKELLISVTDCEYFEKSPAKGSSSSDVRKDTVEVLSAERDSAQLVAQEPKYAFAKEPQLDIQTPHMDPAVVAVSSYAPPPMGSQVRGSQLAPHKSASVGSLPRGQTAQHVPQAQQHTVEIQATNVFSINAMNTNSLSMARVNHGMDSMNLNNLQTEPPTDSSEIDQWNPDETKFQQSTNNKFRRSSGHNSESNEQYEIEFFDPQSATGSRAGNNNWSNDMLTGGDRSHGYRRGTGDRERGGFRGGRGMNGYRGRGGGGGGNRWNGPPNDRFDEQRNNFSGGDREYKPRGGSRGVGNGRGGNQFNGGGGGRRPYRGGGFNSGGQDSGVMNVFS